MKTYILVFASLLGVLNAAEAREYSLKEIVKRFVEYSPDLKAARSSYMTAHYDAKKATSKFFPTVALNGSVTEYKNPSISSSPLVPTTGKQYIGSIDIAQPILAGGAIWRGMELAQLNKHLQEQTYLNTKQEAISGVISSALALATIREQIKILEESQKYQERFYNLTKNKAARGAAKSYEVSQSHANFLSYTPRLANLRQQLSDAVDRLRISLGLDKSEALEVSLQKPSRVDALDLDKLLSQANENRPKVKMAALSVEMAKQTKWINLAEDLPSLSLVGSVGYKSPTQDDFSKDTTKYHSIGLVAKIPLFSGLSSVNKYQSGEESIRASEQSLSSTQNSIRQEVKSALESVTTAQTLFTSSGEWAVEARKALNSSIDSYRIGVTSSLQVIQTQQGWEAAELSLISSQQAFQSSLLNLRKAIGTDLEKVYTEN